jgi:glycosyltransferase involved in cell wall biosynthesis
LVYYSYMSEPGNEVGFLPPEQYVARRSPTLIDNPQARLEERKEVARYLDTLSPDYRHELETVSASIPPMSKNCRLSIGIPAFREGENIGKTLEHYAHQIDKNGTMIDQSRFEVELVVFDHHPSNVPKDNTQEEVDRFRRDHPDIKIIYIYRQEQPQEPSTVTFAEKYLADLALLRSSQRQHEDGDKDFILVCNSADAEGISDDYVDRIITAFDNNPNIDALTGKSVLPDSAMQKPNILAATRFWGFMSVIIEGGGGGEKKYKEPVGMNGRNMAMRSSVYAAVGGFNPETKYADDLELSWLIADARGWDPDRIIFLDKAEIETDPRRHLAAIATNNTIFGMYLNFYHNTDEIRNADNAELLRRIPDDLDIDLLEKEVDAWWQAKDTGEYAYLGARFEPAFKRAMNFLGVSYEIVDDHIKITSAEKLLGGLSKSYGREVKALPRKAEFENEALDGVGEEKHYSSGLIITELRAKHAREYEERIAAAEAGKEIVLGDIKNIGFLKEQYSRFAGK